VATSAAVQKKDTSSAFALLSFPSRPTSSIFHSSLNVVSGKIDPWALRRVRRIMKSF